MNGFLPPDGAAYLDALRRELADLPVEERDELLAEVESSLLAAAAEGDEQPSARLGPPARFAAELRAAGHRACLARSHSRVPAGAWDRGYPGCHDHIRYAPRHRQGRRANQRS